MGDDRRREADFEGTEARIRATARNMNLSVRQAEAVVRDHIHLGRAMLAEMIARALAIGEEMAIADGEPWDESAREAAVVLGYTFHVLSLVALGDQARRWPDAEAGGRSKPFSAN